MKVFNILVNYFKKHIFIFLFLICVLLGVTLLALIPPKLLQILIDDVFTNKNTSNLLFFSLFYMLSLVSVELINFLKEVILVVISQGFNKSIRLNMLSKINHLTYTELKNIDSGIMESYFSNDIEEVNALITSGAISLIIDTFKIIGIIVSIFLLSYILGLITLLILPLLILFILFMRKRMRNAQKENRELEAKVNFKLLESLDNIISIKSFRIYKIINEKYNDILLKHFKVNQKSNGYDAIFPPIMQISKIIVIVLIIILSAFYPNLFLLSVGAIASLIDLITSLFSPLENLGMEIQTIQKSMAALERINNFLSLKEDDIKSFNSDLDFQSLELKFDNVSFKYDDGNEFVIKDFNLSIKNNEKITLKGVSGSGKSTLFKLAYGLIKPSKGRVTINNIDTYLLSNELKRKIFGIVYQDYYFSSGTIKEEISLLDSSIDDSKIEETLSKVGLSRINDINKKLNINDYSTGELSLFNIARVVVSDSKILFLDEMNSKIDPLTASKIIKVINELSKEKMILSINHYGELLEDSKIVKIE